MQNVLRFKLRVSLHQCCDPKKIYRHCSTSSAEVLVRRLPGDGSLCIEEAGCWDLSCCYGDSTVTLTKCEIIHTGQDSPSKSPDKDLAVSTHRKVIYSLNTIGGHWW